MRLETEISPTDRAHFDLAAAAAIAESTLPEIRRVLRPRAEIDQLVECRYFVWKRLARSRGGVEREISRSQAALFDLWGTSVIALYDSGHREAKVASLLVGEGIHDITEALADLETNFPELDERGAVHLCTFYEPGLIAWKVGHPETTFYWPICPSHADLTKRRPLSKADLDTLAARRAEG